MPLSGRNWHYPHDPRVEGACARARHARARGPEGANVANPRLGALGRYLGGLGRHVGANVGPEGAKVANPRNYRRIQGGALGRQFEALGRHVGQCVPQRGQRSQSS